MGDILTQIQDHLDILLSMMSKDLEDIRIQAPPSVPPGQQRLDSFAEVEAKTSLASVSENNPSQLTQTASEPSQPAPVIFTQSEFQQKIKDMAIDITRKASQIELLIASLPGLHSSEVDQVKRMKELERELEGLEAERLDAVREKERLVSVVEERIGGVGRR